MSSLPCSEIKQLAREYAASFGDSELLRRIQKAMAIRGGDHREEADGNGSEADRGGVTDGEAMQDSPPHTTDSDGYRFR